MSEISKIISISEGTIYPLLRRVNKEGAVTTYLEESKSRRLDTVFPLSSCTLIVEQSEDVTRISIEQQCDDITEIYVNTVSGDLDIGY